MDTSRNLIPTLKDGDHIRVISDQNLSCHAEMDASPKEASPEDMACMVSHVICDTCCQGTTVPPSYGSSSAAEREEEVGMADLAMLSDAECLERFSAVNGFDNDVVPESMDTRERCIHVAGKAIEALFPNAAVQDMEVMRESSFSHLGMIRCLDFFLKGIASINHKKDHEKLRSLRDDAEDHVNGRKFRDFYEVHAMMIDGSCWVIPVSYDFRKAFVCRDRDERSRFCMHLGVEYQEASLAVDRFKDECCSQVLNLNL